MPKDTSLYSLLDRHIRTLSMAIGERHSKRPEALNRACEYIVKEFEHAGYEPKLHTFEYRGQTFANVEAIRPGKEEADENLIVGAHYDSEFNTPGANDNGSGVAAMLAIAYDLKDYKPKKTIRYVAFVNEESPFFNTDGMGSLNYARDLRYAEAKVAGMFSLETLGYFTAGAGSQQYPDEVKDMGFPDEGNFLAFIGNKKSSEFLDKSWNLFKLFSNVPSLGLAAKEEIPGVANSDHFSFWKYGYPGIMVTDTAPYRYPHYHAPDDVPEKINMKVYKEAVLGLIATVAALAGKSGPVSQ